jgi:putative FmdB family regulatory protein
MPIYAYACESCGHELEALQKISDAVLVDCPMCHKPGLRKQLTAPSFRLSGSGWYETDFKKDGKKNIAGEKPACAGSANEGGCGSGACVAAAGDK